MLKTYYAKQIFLSDRILENGYLTVEDGRIKSITDKKPSDTEIVSFEDKIIAPGLVDLHIHGLYSHDVMDNDKNGMLTISAKLPSCGVTSYFPTTLTSDRKTLKAVSKTVYEVSKIKNGAKIQGIFYEGPFFTEKHKGAQNEKYMTDPDINVFNEWKDELHELAIRIGIAPERKGAAKFVKEAIKEGVIVGIGHSDATYDEAKECLDNGASFFVHTYNGMSGLNSRKPGMVGAALSYDHVYSELICDGHHVHPASCKIVMKCRGKDEIIFVTDCMRAGGMGNCISKLGEFDVIVKDGQARLKNGGNLAGSVLELKNAVKNVVEWGFLTPFEAVKAASYNPAKSVGKEDEFGQLKEKMPADFIVLDDDMNLILTYVDGVKKYEK